MKILIVYYTQTGRTKKISEAIASSLINHDMDFIRFELMGKFSERFKMSGSIRMGDYSLIEKELNSLSSAEFDLVIIGMPTHGGPPPKIFNEIVVQMGDLNGKKAIVFNTARITGRSTTDLMAAKLTEAGANVIGKKRFRGLFRLGISDAVRFGNEIDQNL